MDDSLEDLKIDMLPPFELSEEDCMPSSLLSYSARPPSPMKFSPLKAKHALARKPLPPANGMSIRPRETVVSPMASPNRSTPTFMMPTKAAQLKQRIKRPAHATGVNLRR
jgi:hypothetical protein